MLQKRGRLLVVLVLVSSALVPASAGAEGPPTIHIAEPTDGAVYYVGEIVNAHFTCDDPDTPPTACTGTVASGDDIDTTTVASDAAIDTTTVGTYSFTVEVTPDEGTRPVTHSYSIVPDPPVCQAATRTTAYGQPVPVALDCEGLIDEIEIDPVTSGATPTGDAATDTVEYQPAPFFWGTDRLTLRVRRTGGAWSNDFQIAITVTTPPYTGGGGGGGDPFTPAGPSGLVPDQPDEPGEPLPAIPFLPSLFPSRNGNFRTAFARNAAVTVSRRAIRAASTGRVRLKIRNANPFPVEGRLVVEGAFRRTKHRRATRPRLRMGESQLSIARRKSITVVLALSPAEQLLLAQLGQARMRASFRVRDLDRHVRTIRTTFTLRAP